MADLSKFSPDNGVNVYDLKDSVARTNIGTLSNLSTTAKNDIVSAINEVSDLANSAEKKKITSVKCKPVSNGTDWGDKTWTGLTSFDGSRVWTDGDNIYYSYGSDQYVLDTSTSTWTTKTWIGLTSFDGLGTWTDGDNIYYSTGSSNQYVLDKATSTWNAKTWTGLTNFLSSYIWTDGDNIYYSGIGQYVLDKATSTWNAKTWTGLTDFTGIYIWTDGDNIYYSGEFNGYVLDKSTSTWSRKTWNGLTRFEGVYIWTDGDDIYYSKDSDQYILDKATSTWNVKTWTGLTSFSGSRVWTDGDNIYYSSDSTQYVLNKNITPNMDSYKNTLSDINSAVGDISTLTTTAKTNTVSAINEVDSDVDGTQANLGSLTNLSTVSKINAVSAINEINNNLNNIMSYIGMYGEDIVGLEVDFENYTYKRLSAAIGLNAGTDFNRFDPFGGRRRCNVDDSGTVIAWYGDADYAEDGSNGQVMVYQPKFYYFVAPLKTEPINDAVGGLHMRKAQYFVSANPHKNFKLFPAFYDKNGNEIDFIFLSAYEGSVYDVSAQSYILDDAQTTDFTVGTGDKLSSIAGAKPCSGRTQNLTRANSEIISQNRGDIWHSDTIKAESLNQLLFMIEYGTLNSQNAIGKGVASKTDDGSTNMSEITGATSSLGNSTGMANGTNGLVSVSYRGIENFWGNIWKFTEGLTLWGDGALRGGQPYICDNYSFVEDTKTGYTAVKFTVTNTIDYISAFGYDPDFDWLFLPSECVNANSNYPIGDYSYVTSNLNGFRLSLLGTGWNDGVLAGAFGWDLAIGAGYRYRNVGARLTCIPESIGNDVYGLQVDYENKTFKRLSSATGKTGGSDFSNHTPQSGMRRCNLADDGTVNAYYGDASYTEDGSNGQVMVEIPKFYYRVVPLKTEPIGDSVGGKHLRKANYYISATKYDGFKTFPLFVKPDGTERDKAYVSAYDGCIYDASESAYILDDAQVADFTASTGDKLCSIAGAKPASGLTQNLTRANSEILATNRGSGWHCMDIKAASAVQLLFMIEYGTLNSQNAIGLGVVNKSDDGSTNMSEITGTTSSLGNSTGMASGTSGLVSVSYRGIENFWGNIWKFTEGLTLWGDGTLRGGQPYICDDYTFAKETKTGYTGAKFTVSNANNYVSAFGYDPDFDWLFLPSECVNADSNYPVGDYVYVTSDLNGYRLSRLGACWADGVQAGAFCWILANGAGYRSRNIGVRLMYIS